MSNGMYQCDKSSFFDESLLVLSGVKGEKGMAKNIISYTVFTAIG